MSSSVNFEAKVTYKLEDDDTFQTIPSPIENNIGFIVLKSIDSYLKHRSVAIGLTDDFVYHLNFNKIEKTDQINVFDYYSVEYQMTSMTIELNENRFKLKFDELTQLGSRGFGCVVKVKDRYTDRISAIKKIELKNLKGNLNQHT